MKIVFRNLKCSLELLLQIWLIYDVKVVVVQKHICRRFQISLRVHMIMFGDGAIYRFDTERESRVDHLLLVLNAIKISQVSCFQSSDSIIASRLS